MTPTFRTSQPGSEADAGKAHVILVGLPGCGKSTVGRAVAERLGRRFLDLDLEIERREGKSVAEIFGEHGEGYFRQRERELTQELAETGNMIVAPGGGWIMNQDVVRVLRPPSRLLYLKVGPEVALARLGQNRSLRPLLSRPDPSGELKRLYAERRLAYESADYTVDTELYSLQRVIEKVVETVSQTG